MLDCDNINWACRKGLPCSSGSNRVLYGGGGVGVLGGIVAKTDDEHILQLDLLATDVYRASDNPSTLCTIPKRRRLRCTLSAIAAGRSVMWPWTLSAVLS